MPIRITHEYLDAHRTDAGAWTKAQFAALGIVWPPVAGWRLRLVGSRLEDVDAAAFEAGRFKRRSSAIERPRTPTSHDSIDARMMRGESIPALRPPQVSPMDTPGLFDGIDLF